MSTKNLAEQRNVKLTRRVDGLVNDNLYSPPVRPIHVAKAVGVVLNTLLFGPLVILASAVDRDAKLAYKLALAWVQVNLWIAGVWVAVEGRENVDSSRQYVFMSNHRSNADIVAIAWALQDFQLRWVAKKELLRVPIFGWGLKALKNIIIDRSNREEAIRSYALARERISRGISVMVFPEGTRGAGTDLLPFKKGGFVLAIETGTPIVPIAVRETTAVLARRGWKIEKGRVQVFIGRPIETSGCSVEEKDRLIRQVGSAIRAMLPPPEAPPAAGHA